MKDTSESIGNYISFYGYHQRDSGFYGVDFIKNTMPTILDTAIINSIDYAGTSGDGKMFSIYTHDNRNYYIDKKQYDKIIELMNVIKI